VAVFDIDPAANPEGLSLREAAVALENLLVSYATGGDERDADYQALRDRLMVETRRDLPEFVRTARNLRQFWAYIKQWSTYAERRDVLWGAFGPFIETLTNEGRPVDDVAIEALAALDAGHVALSWQKALDRRTGDPEGAITAARTTLESVCKLILDDYGVQYTDDDLPKLYKKVADQMKLAPSDHTEQAFKQILSGCYSVVNGLGTLRNRLSDSHGQGVRPVRPAPRHADLSVNLAGAMATFLVQTWQARKEEGDLPG
jgi:hypothetical protein